MNKILHIIYNIFRRKPRAKGKVYPPKPWPDPPKIIPHWKSREWWDR